MSKSYAQPQLQKESPLLIGVEYGSYGIKGDINNYWEFRPPINRHPHEMYKYKTANDHLTGKGAIHYMGIKTEFPKWGNRLTFKTGLRYTLVDEQIVPMEGNSLYLFQPSPQGIELFRISEMKEILGYVGIPLETDFLLWGKYSNWQGYLKAGIQGGIKVHGNTTINFVSREMQKQSTEIIEAASKENTPFFVNYYAGLGLRLLLQNGIRFSAEVHLPPQFLTKGNYGLLTTQSFGGTEFSVSIPFSFISSNNKIKNNNNDEKNNALLLSRNDNSYRMLPSRRS